jgi:hypothetical protein
MHEKENALRFLGALMQGRRRRDSRKSARAECNIFQSFNLLNKIKQKLTVLLI